MQVARHPASACSTLEVARPHARRDRPLDHRGSADRRVTRLCRPRRAPAGIRVDGTSSGSPRYSIAPATWYAAYARHWIDARQRSWSSTVRPPKERRAMRDELRGATRESPCTPASRQVDDVTCRNGAFSWEPWHYGYTLNARLSPSEDHGGDGSSAIPSFVP